MSCRTRRSAATAPPEAARPATRKVNRMSFEALKAAIATLMDEIVRRPEDRHVLQEQLREKISELETMGLPVPEDFREFEKSLSDDDVDDPFDNLPV